MAEKVTGSGAQIKFNVHGSLEVYCYAKSFQIDISTEYVAVSTIGDGMWPKSKPKRHRYTITMDAIYLVTDNSPLVSSPDFLEQQLQGIETPFEILYTGESGGIQSMNGRVWIENLSFSATPSGFVAKNVSMRGNGRLNRGVAPVSLVDLEIQAFATGSGATAAIENVIITDQDGNETTVLIGPQGAGAATTVQIPAGVYHIRAELSGNQTYNLLESDAAPGFTENLGGPLSSYVYWPYPPNSPVWDFSVNRFLRFHTSDVPLA